jgi:ATP-dependent helicase HrpA
MKQHREGIIRLVHLQLGDLIRQLKKQIAKPLALAYSPLGDRAKLEQMLVYATLQVSIEELPKNADEFEQLLNGIKKQFLSHGQQTLTDLTDIFTQWQQVRRELLVLDQNIFARSLDDIEDQLDLMSLADFVYSQPAEIWQEYPRYLKALLLRLDRLPNNLQRDLAAIKEVDPWMDKVFKFKNNPKIKELYVMLEELRISLFSQPMKTKLPISATRLQKLWDCLAIG